VSDYTLPKGNVTQVATNGNSIVQLTKVSEYARGKVPDVAQELRDLQAFKQSNRKAFDADPSNASRLKKLKGMSHNYDRSNVMAQQLESIGLVDNAANNQLITEHLLNIGKTVTPENHKWVPSVLDGPNGQLKVETTWNVLDDGNVWLSTLLFKPM
jgi:hypothetical protein